jgi:hypothetical protein
MSTADSGDELDLALKEYFLLEKDERFSNDPILAFRIASALKLRGDSDLALDKFVEAVEKLRHSDIDPSHAMRVRIPRQLSIMYWEMAEGIKRKGIQLKNPDLLLKVRQGYYLKALDLNLSVFDRDIGSDATGHQVRADKEEARITLNNILEYMLCYLSVGGTWNSLNERNLSKTKVRELLDELIGDSISTIDRATVADTVRAAARFIGDTKLANDAARRVLQLIERPDFAFNLPEEALIEMRTDAELQLSAN